MSYNCNCSMSEPRRATIDFFANDNACDTVQETKLYKSIAQAARFTASGLTNNVSMHASDFKCSKKEC